MAFEVYTPVTEMAKPGPGVARVTRWYAALHEKDLARVGISPESSRIAVLIDRQRCVMGFRLAGDGEFGMVPQPDLGGWWRVWIRGAMKSMGVPPASARGTRPLDVEGDTLIVMLDGAVTKSGGAE